MKTISNITKGMLQFAAVALVVASVAIPQTASANTGANATILNVVQVDYKDASGTTSYAETASSTVTVNLVGALPVISAVAAQTVASGGTATYVYTITSQANGKDTYNLVAGNTPANMASSSSTPSVASIILGSSVVTEVTAANQVKIPAGSATDLTVGDIVVVGGTDYKISALTIAGGAVTVNGAPASHTNTLGDGAAGTTIVEKPVLVTLVANNTLATASTVAGSNTAPAFTVGTTAGTTGGVVGGLIAEQGTFTVAVTGVADATVNPHTVDTPITATPATPPATGPVFITTPPVTTTFSGPNVTIVKEVYNETATPGGVFGTTASGAPGDTLTYRITVTNAGTGSATAVVVSDPMPLYTTYTAGTAKSDTAAVAYAAAATVLTDDPLLPTVDGYDFNVASKTATLNIGTLAGGVTSVLFYQVTID